MCVCVDWDSALLPNEALLDTVSRFVLAVLLKHTGLMGQACGEGRYDIIFYITREFYTVDTTKEFISYFLSSFRYQPCKVLAEVYRSVYKVRNRLLACKNMELIQTRSSSRERRV